MDLYNGNVRDHCASSAMDFHQVHCWKPSRRTFRRTYATRVCKNSEVGPCALPTHAPASRIHSAIHEASSKVFQTVKSWSVPECQTHPESQIRKCVIIGLITVRVFTRIAGFVRVLD